MSHTDVFKSEVAKWVWPAGVGGPNQYVEFRHEFELGETSDAKLYIGADSNYAVWINGRFVDTGQYPDYPEEKTCDVLSASEFLKTGANVLSVLVFYQGADSSMYKKGEPGLIYALEAGDLVVASGEDTAFRRSKSYKNGEIPWVTGQLTFTFEFDGREHDGWTNEGYFPDGSWQKASDADIIPLESRPVVRKRPIKKLEIEDQLPVKLVAQGVLKREPEGKKTIAQLMQTDFLSHRLPQEIFEGQFSVNFPSEDGATVHLSATDGSNGAYFIFDLGKEEAGLFELEIEASEGTIVDIGYGEHLDDLRVRTYIAGRNFANRYICREGRQRFTHYTSRLAGRYVELHVTNLTYSLKLFYAGFSPTPYPVERLGSFDCSDSLHNRINEVSIRTLHLCMHEHYEDCPWREQSLYAMDSRNQALAGYYCFGDYELPAASFELLGKGWNDDGWLELCAPANIPLTIPVFSFAWLLAVGDNYLYSGNLSNVEREYPVIKKLLESCESSLQDGLLPSPQGERYWHFYDWMPGLDGCDGHTNKFYLELFDQRFDAPLNMFYILALESAADMAGALDFCGDAEHYKALAESVRAKAHKVFWDQANQAYVTYVRQDKRRHYGELTQALAILSGVASDDTADKFRAALASPDNGWTQASISHSLYTFEAMMTDAKTYAKRVFEIISEKWGYMLSQGATSFWETLIGADDFGYAGSLCHGWSGIPTYFYAAYILGIKPTSPGFATFTYEPVTDVFEQAEGLVPTPMGPISVSWTRCDDEVTSRVETLITGQ